MSVLVLKFNKKHKFIDSMKTQIHVSGMESKSFDNGGSKITILDGKKKFGFYTTKKDGSYSKAHEGWEKLRPRVGDVVSAEVEEEPKTFTDPRTRKVVNYTDRRILFFYTDGNEMEVNNVKPVKSQNSPDRIDILEEKIERIMRHLNLNPIANEAPTPSGMPDDDIPTIQIPGFEPDDDEINVSDVPF